MGFIYTADQHRAFAGQIRRNAGLPHQRTLAEAEVLALNHEGVARLIEAWIAGGCIAVLFRSPSLVPRLQEQAYVPE